MCIFHSPLGRSYLNTGFTVTLCLCKIDSHHRVVCKWSHYRWRGHAPLNMSPSDTGSGEHGLSGGERSSVPWTPHTMSALRQCWNRCTWYCYVYMFYLLIFGLLGFKQFFIMHILNHHLHLVNKLINITVTIKINGLTFISIFFNRLQQEFI